MKREDLIRDIRRLARKNDAHFRVVPGRGKGSHYRVDYADRWTTVQAGELAPLQAGEPMPLQEQRIRKQLGIV